MLTRLSLSQTNRPVEVVLYWRQEKQGLYLDPPYQRGDVWGQKRRQNFIRSIMIGVPIPSLIINDRFSANWESDWRIAVIDGKQRITTILKFIDGDLSVPGEWFGIDDAPVRYPQLPALQQRVFRQRPIPFSEGTLPTLEDEQTVFDLVNFGGLAQGERDE